MGTLSFDIRGDSPPFNVCLTSGSTIIQSFSGMTVSGTTGFTSVDIGSYDIVVQDAILNTCSVPLIATTTTTTMAPTTSTTTMSP